LFLRKDFILEPVLEKPPFKHRLILRLLPLAVGLIKLLCATVRVRVIDPQRNAPANHPQPVIYAFWHEHQVLAMSAFRNFGIRVLVSRSRDGDYISGALESFGFKTVRSSSSSGKITALRGLARELRHGFHAAITPDGPRGPRHESQPGPIFLGAMTGFQVVPFGCALDRAWRLKSWDRFEIPQPFSRAAVVFGQPLKVPPKLDETQATALVAELQKRLQELEAQAQLAVVKPT
jgi:lysophospholipid acyltransferase (LPLAT)-like uncharacterized protein